MDMLRKLGIKPKRRKDDSKNNKIKQQHQRQEGLSRPAWNEDIKLGVTHYSTSVNQVAGAAGGGRPPSSSSKITLLSRNPGEWGFSQSRYNMHPNNSTLNNKGSKSLSFNRSVYNKIEERKREEEEERKREEGMMRVGGFRGDRSLKEGDYPDNLKGSERDGNKLRGLKGGGGKITLVDRCDGVEVIRYTAIRPNRGHGEDEDYDYNVEEGGRTITVTRGTSPFNVKKVERLLGGEGEGIDQQCDDKRRRNKSSHQSSTALPPRYKEMNYSNQVPQSSSPNNNRGFPTSGREQIAQIQDFKDLTSAIHRLTNLMAKSGNGGEGFLRPSPLLTSPSAAAVSTSLKHSSSPLANNNVVLSPSRNKSNTSILQTNNITTASQLPQPSHSSSINNTDVIGSSSPVLAAKSIHSTSRRIKSNGPLSHENHHYHAPHSTTSQSKVADLLRSVERVEEEGWKLLHDVGGGRGGGNGSWITNTNYNNEKKKNVAQQEQQQQLARKERKQREEYSKTRDTSVKEKMFDDDVIDEVIENDENEYEHDAFETGYNVLDENAPSSNLSRPRPDTSIIPPSNKPKSYRLPTGITPSLYRALQLHLRRVNRHVEVMEAPLLNSGYTVAGIAEIMAGDMLGDMVDECIEEVENGIKEGAEIIFRQL